MKNCLAASAFLIILTSGSSHAFYSDGYQEYGVDDLSQAIVKINEYGVDSYVQDLYEQAASKLDKYGDLGGCSTELVYDPETNTVETRPRLPPSDLPDLLLFMSYCEYSMKDEGVQPWNKVAEQTFDVSTEQFLNDMNFIRGVGCLAMDVQVYPIYGGVGFDTITDYIYYNNNC